MAKGAKIWLTVAVILIISGILLFACTMTANGWDFSKLDTTDYKTNTYSLRESFRNISIAADTADILFASSTDGSCTVLCYEAANAGHTVSVVDDTLTIQVDSSKNLLDYIGMNFETPTITVYLPEAEYQSLSIRSSTGDIEIPAYFLFADMDIHVSTGNIQNFASVSGAMSLRVSTGNIAIESITASALTLTTSTGRITGNNIICTALRSTGNTGDIILKNVIAEDAISIERSTGDVTLQSCDAPQLWIQTNTGDVTGSLLSRKVFIVQSDTGKITVPESTTGGTCKISTTTGDIRITLVND